MTRIDTMELPGNVACTAALRIAHYWRDRPHTFWLDSADNSTRLGRFSFLGSDPYATLRADGPLIDYNTHAAGEERLSEGRRSGGRPWKGRTWDGDPLQALADVAENVLGTEFPAGFPAPFAGGLVGYIAYDVGARAASVPLRARRDVDMPDVMFGLYDAVVCIDHFEQRLYIVSTGLPQSGRAAVQRADARVKWLRREVEQSLAVGSGPATSCITPAAPVAPAAPAWRTAQGPVSTKLLPTVPREAYLQTIKRAMALIDAEEIDQVNLSQRFTVPTAVSGPELHRRVRAASPAPFAAMLRADDAWIVSSSPERFLHIRGDHIEMRPIKGTRPRGRDAATDARYRAALVASEKDAAEHKMIVAMEQAALERLCRPGSVHVPERMVCEEYETVFHLVSTVAGRLLAGVTAIDCVRALFPGGSVTGRPKTMAMRLIDELEAVRRGVYTGAIGYLGVGGNVDLNVAIRTVVLQGEKAHFHVGGAIVAGSDPEDEYEETLDKAEGMVRALLAPGA